MQHKPSVSDIDAAPEVIPSPHSMGAVTSERFSQVADENFELKTEIASLKSKLQTKEAMDKLIVPYANKVFYFLCCYGFGAFFIIMLNRFKYKDFSLDNTVLSIIVSSTAVSAIGLVGLVVKGLFRPGS